MSEGCEYRGICEAYKVYFSHPELSLYNWLKNNCDKMNIGICANLEKFKETNKLEKDVQDK